MAIALRDTFGSQGATWEELAAAMQLGPTSVTTKYLVWSAEAYGLLAREGKEIRLSETGRKIVAPTYTGEDHEGRIKAILTPSLLSKFYSDYDGHPIPSPDHFGNLLENRYELPRERVSEAQEIILENASFVGVLQRSTPDAPPRIVIRGADVGRAATISGRDTPPPHEGDSGVESDAEWEKVLFFIAPIGEDESEYRKHSDMLLRHLIEPVASEHGLRAVRADGIERSGLITRQILEYLVRARVCVADLSFGNSNVFYELGVRHTAKRPTVQVIRRGDKIPFDLSQGRTIKIDTTDVYTYASGQPI